MLRDSVHKMFNLCALVYLCSHRLFALELKDVRKADELTDVEGAE